MASSGCKYVAASRWFCCKCFACFVHWTCCCCRSGWCRVCASGRLFARLSGDCAREPDATVCVCVCVCALRSTLGWRISARALCFALRCFASLCCASAACVEELRCVQRLAQTRRRLLNGAGGSGQTHRPEGWLALRADPSDSLLLFSPETAGPKQATQVVVVIAPPGEPFPRLPSKRCHLLAELVWPKKPAAAAPGIGANVIHTNTKCNAKNVSARPGPAGPDKHPPPLVSLTCAARARPARADGLELARRLRLGARRFARLPVSALLVCSRPASQMKPDEARGSPRKPEESHAAYTAASGGSLAATILVGQQRRVRGPARPAGMRRCTFDTDNEAAPAQEAWP